MRAKTYAVIIAFVYGLTLLACVLVIGINVEVLPAAGRNHSYDRTYKWGIRHRTGQIQPDFDNFFDIKKYNSIGMGSKDVKLLYLTFDCGYEDGNMESILNTLKERNTPAAFFITGHYARKNPEVIKRMQEEGHLICNHTDSHADGRKIHEIGELKRELEGAEEACRIAGVEMTKYYRPSEGVYSERLLDFANRLGYKTVFWSFAYVDWQEKSQPSPKYAVANFMKRLHPGEIIMLHSTSATNVKILSEIILKAKQEGYEFRSLDQLI